MEKNMEVNIAFRIWNQINQLESILWDRYRDEFLSLTIEQDDANIAKDNNQDLNDPFQLIDNATDENVPFYR